MRWVGNTTTGWRKSAISVLARTLLGLPLAAVLGIVGMAIASAMSVFFGVSALPTLLLLLTIGAGIGAGIGGGAMLIRVDAVPPWPAVLAIGVGIALVSAGGAWAGLEIGDKITAMQEMNCVGVCDYFFKPRTYMALGATVVSNAIALAFNIVYEVRSGGWDWPRFRPDGTSVGASGDAERRA